MVLVSKLRYLSGVLFFLILSILFSCEEVEHLVANCGDCLENDPNKVFVKLKVNPSNQSGVLIKVYEGRLTDSLQIDSFLTGEREESFEVTVNRTYTFTATYKTGDITIVAVDEVTPTVRLDESSCDNPCYWVIDNVVNLRNQY